MNKRQFFKTLGALFIAPTLTVTTMTDTFAQNKNSSKIAVVYYTRSGNTESVALAVRAATGADIFRVETVEPYPEEYRATTKVVQEEIEKEISRPIKPVAIDLSKYDVIILASPTWWYHIAAPLATWIKSVDLSGKLILTCNTHGGSGVINTRDDFEKLLPNCKLGTHFSTYGSVGLKSRGVTSWLRENGLLKCDIRGLMCH